MPKFERKFADFFVKHSSILFFIVISLIGFWIRYVGRHFLSSDMFNVLIPWYEVLQERGGLPGLKEQVGDYNVLYQTMIAFMTYIPLNPMTMYKVISGIFDYLMAFSVASFVCTLRGEKKFSVTFNCLYAIIICLPTVVLNSAFWGQCDSMYVYCILIALILMYKDKYLPAFIILGVSFALKIQTVFVLPFLISYYFVKKKFSFGMFFVMLFSFWACGGVAYIFGRDLLAPFKVYFNQANFYQKMWLDARSFWQLFGDDYQHFSSFAVILTFAICGLGFYMCLKNKKRMDTPIQVLSTIAWFTWTCIFFLPAMHDRYAYLLDIILIMMAFLDKRYIKFAAFSCVLSFMSYPSFLIWMNGVNRADAFIEFFVYVYFTYLIMKPSENLPAENRE